MYVFKLDAKNKTPLSKRNIVKELNWLTDKRVIGLFVNFLVNNGNTGLTISSWPDEENRQTSDIDAIAGSFAIEHSSVDTVQDQRRDSAWFLEVVKPLEEEFFHKLPFRLNLILPYEGIQRGQKWPKITSALLSWIRDESPKLAFGSHEVRSTPGIPFTFHVIKKRSDRPGLILGRFAPDIQGLSSRLRKQLDRKAVKLSRYKSEGKITILLVESNDIALMDDSKMWESLKQAYPNGLPDGVDQVWYADSSIPENILFTEMTRAFIR